MIRTGNYFLIVKLLIYTHKRVFLNTLLLMRFRLYIIVSYYSCHEYNNAYITMYGTI